MFEEYLNIYDKALTSDVTTDEDINSQSKKEHVNLIKTDDEEDADVDPQSLVNAKENYATIPWARLKLLGNQSLASI